MKKFMQFQFAFLALIATVAAFATVGDKRGKVGCPGCCKSDHTHFSKCNTCDMTTHKIGCPERHRAR